MIQLDGIHHISATTADAACSVDFYARLLGLRLAKKTVNQDEPTVHHLLLAVVSLITIAVGLTPLLLGKRSPMVITTHAYCMTWSYAGLVAAGCGQLTVAIGDVGSWSVPVAIATVLLISGALIFGRVPSILDRVLAKR